MSRDGLVMVSDIGVQMDLSFSFNAAPTIDVLLDFRGLNEGG